MKSKDLQTRLLYSAKLSFKPRDRKRASQKKNKKGGWGKLEEFTTTKPVLQDMLKGLPIFLKKKKKNNNNKNINNEKGINVYLSTIILNANGLNAPIKRHMEAEWIAKQDPYICCLQETHFRSKGILILKVK